jgi:hypothetical protein
MRLLIAIGIFIVHAAHAQLIQVPLPTQHQPNQANPNARTKSVLSLPFWDDFSQVSSTTPSADLWLAGKSVWVNTSMAINPPSLNVASFDGIDSLGRPYSINDVLAKGFADKLESHPIDLTQVALADRTTVYLSFFYQLKGRGELPDAGDRLILEFRNATGGWEEMWALENDGLMATDVFTQVVVPILSEAFYHEGFQFRFKNFARLSGPYDTWHVDYIYINTGRTDTDTSYPDRSIVSPLSSIFSTYTSIPKTHFFPKKDSMLTKPTMVVHNLLAGNQQPVNYFSFVQIDRYEDGASVTQPELPVDNDVSIGAVDYLQYKTAEIELAGLSTLLDESADSLFVSIKVGLNTDDNVPPGPPGFGNYDPKYTPIDFRLNDTTRTEHWIASFYAYDDGTAEYGAALNQPGAQVAYEFNLVGEAEGVINSVQLYFPRFGDESSQVIELIIWNDLLETETSVLYREVVELQRSENNVMWLKKLGTNVEVGRRFYIGWKQTSATIIAVGLDKNTNSGEKMFYNVSGTWEPNIQLTGSLMIRPVFGGESETDPDPETEVRSDIESGLAPWPNPTNESFVVPGYVTDLQLRDISGRVVPCAVVETAHESTVTINDPRPGVYIVQYMRDGYPRRSRIMVR